MDIAEYYPYRTAAARDDCFRYLDGLAARLWPIVSEERMIPTTWGATFVRIAGPPAAPLLVLLHGAGTTSLMWSPNIGALSGTYRTVAVDQAGEFGKSACSKPPRTLPDLMAWLDELIAALADAEWQSLRTPTLFLAGEHEVIYSARKTLDRLRRVAPQVEAEIVPGAGHDLTFVRTAVVNRRILEFLQTASARSASAAPRA